MTFSTGRLYSLMIGFIGVALACFVGCQQAATSDTWYQTINGQTMGTTYAIVYEGEKEIQDEVDSILVDVNNALSTYIPTSLISQFNATNRLDLPLDGEMPNAAIIGYMVDNYRLANTIYQKSQGAFDPTVGGLVNAWGFGWDGKQPNAPSKGQLDSLLQFVGYDKIELRENDGDRYLQSDIAGVQLDYSALAKGYGVDVICEYLTSLGIENWFVEIGGEVRTHGVSARNDKWRVGINQPDPSASAVALYRRVELSGQAMATSGNYRNYYQLDGQRVWHTINPKTGYPEPNNVLSVSIVHENCAVADGLATACMVLGLEKGLKCAEEFEGAEGFFIYNENGEMAELMTTGFTKYLMND